MSRSDTRVLICKCWTHSGKMIQITALNALLGLILVFLPTMAVQAQQPRIEPVHFAGGADGTTINDTITGRESVSYVLGAEAGQRLAVTLSSTNVQTFFNVYGPGSGPGDQAIANSGILGDEVPDLNRFEAELVVSGEYTILVYMMRAAARRGERSDFALDLRLSGEMSERVTADFADGLQGGPDFYRVKTASGGPLNLRARPSLASAVLARLRNRTELRNLGCRMAEGRRWCRVGTLTAPALEGWVAGAYLVESGGPGNPVASSRKEAEDACLRDVSTTTSNPVVTLIGSSMSPAGMEVIVGVGPQHAPWKCVVGQDGATFGIMSLTDEGAL